MTRATGVLFALAAFLASPTAPAVSQLNTRAFWRDSGPSCAKTLGTAGVNEQFYSVDANPDGTFIMTGEYWPTSGNADALVTKYDADLKELWSVTYGNSDNNAAEGIARMDDGGFIFPSMMNASMSCHIVKLDASGATAWSKTISFASGAWCFRTVRASDGDDAYVGMHYWFWNGSAWLGRSVMVKIDSSGTVAWKKWLDVFPGGNSVSELANPVIAAADGSLYSIVYEQTSQKSAIVKWTSAGAVTWTREITAPISVSIQNGVELADGGIVLVGKTNASGAGGFDLVALKVTSAGALQWVKTYGSAEDEDVGAQSSARLDDGGVVFGGSTIVSGVKRPILVKIDSATGAIVWSYQYPSLSAERFASVRLTSGRLLVGGGTAAFGAGGSDGLVAMFNTRGQMTKACTKFQKNLALTTGTPAFTLTARSPAVNNVTEAVANTGLTATVRTPATVEAPVCN